MHHINDNFKGFPMVIYFSMILSQSNARQVIPHVVLPNLPLIEFTYDGTENARICTSSIVDRNYPCNFRCVLVSL